MPSMWRATGSCRAASTSARQAVTQQNPRGAVHRCIHSVGHLIEDHAAAAGLPLRFAATKLVEGDTLLKKPCS